MRKEQKIVAVGAVTGIAVMAASLWILTRLLSQPLRAS
jgi:hypothetical protein